MKVKFCINCKGITQKQARKIFEDLFKKFEPIRGESNNNGSISMETKNMVCCV